MKAELEQKIAAACQTIFAADVTVQLTRPEEQFGDYATNMALQLAKQLGKPPRDIADQIAKKLRADLAEQVSDVSVAGPGFINLKLNDQALLELARTPAGRSLEDKIVVAEYSDPSSFKVLHAGHLYTSVVGDAIANLLEAAGGEVHRVNFGGDVGLHVAKTMWAILRELGGEFPEKLSEIAKDKRADWMSARYVEGNAAYEDDEQAKTDIVELNKRVYQLHDDNDHDSPFAQIYWTCRQWSYDYFDQFYARIGSHFEKYYPESVTIPLGLKTVREELAKGVYEESDGAVVFRGEKYGLHTRVFINSHGLPTYEAKDVGLSMLKWQDYHFDRSIILTDNDQAEYMAVVIKSIEQFASELAHATTHLTHGRVKLAGGVKMSSRKGNIVRAVDVLDIAAEANKEANGRDDEQAVLGAVKYAFLKQRIGADIIYDPKESVSLEGNSGPYLQYAHARARSILRKAGEVSDNSAAKDSPDLEPGERSLVRKLGEYPEAVDLAVAELMPHHVCTYLYELAQAFNRFYEHNRVLGDERQAWRLALVQHYAETLKSGLQLLGIAAPEQM
jgi:arginyl-tRNA synthetase